MFSKNSLFVFGAVLLTSQIASCSLIQKNENIIKRKIELYNDAIDIEKYKASYEVDLNTRVITFEVTVETTGFVGFGLSSGRGMEGADIIIGGVRDGETYFSDRHGTGNILPIVDDEENWVLLNASESATHTYLKFSRLLDTCDVQDVPITDDTVSIIWSFGATDDIYYHGDVNRGSVDVNLLDPVEDVDTSEFQTWTITREMIMPKRDTSYWCTIHKAPADFDEKRHIVGFNTKLETADGIAHTHHLVIFRCVAPDGEDPDELFGPHVDQPGGEYYDNNPVIPSQYCTRTLYIWATGGKATMLPEKAGYTLAEPKESAYVMFDIHYNNPTERENITVKSEVEVYHSTEIRPIEAGILMVTHEVRYSQMIPGNAKGFMTIGHCGSACTETWIGPDGINIFNVLFHAHLAGRTAKLRHFRNGEELPWIAADNNYAFDFQQSRPLRKEGKIFQGDHMTVECTYDTTGKGDVTLGGLSTSEEMCQAIMWYYPRSGFSYCGSEYPLEAFKERFGIEEISWPNQLDDPMVVAPASLANRTLVDVLSNTVTWTPAAIAELQQELRFGEHFNPYCGAEHTVATYPEYREDYAPENICAGQSTPSGATNNLFTSTQMSFAILSCIVIFMFHQ